MNPLKLKLIDEVIDREIRVGPDGHYSDDPSDSGGETSWGVTEEVARRYRFKGAMISMTRPQAFEILSKRYWDRIQADKMCTLSARVTEEVFDSAVNMGTTRAVRFLQRSLNVLNNRGRHYADLTVDGQLGALTLKALAHFMTTRNEVVLLRMLNSLQGAFYVKLAERREKDERFIYGWFLNRVVM